MANRYRMEIYQKLSTVIWVTLLLSIGGCSSIPPKQRDDPLIGQIIDAVTLQPVSFESLLDRAEISEVIYLGEKHDNADHHARQLELLQGLAARGVKPAVGFEFFNVWQTANLMQYVDAKSPIIQLTKKSAGKSPETRLRKQLGWQDRSDQDWRFYFQLIEFARQQQLEVFGADLPWALAQRISRAGYESLSGIEKSLLENAETDDEVYREYMYQTFRDSHCGWGEEQYLGRLYLGWRARNQRMARSIVQMREAVPGRPVVLITGNGHVEYNRGVVSRVADLVPGVRQLNLGMWEISIEPRPLSAYLETLPGMGKMHDLVWFSQRRDYGDPCEAFKTF